jgi:hypothetical protein
LPQPILSNHRCGFYAIGKRSSSQEQTKDSPAMVLRAGIPRFQHCHGAGTVNPLNASVL